MCPQSHGVDSECVVCNDILHGYEPDESVSDESCMYQVIFEDVIDQSAAYSDCILFSRPCGTPCSTPPDLLCTSDEVPPSSQV